MRYASFVRGGVGAVAALCLWNLGTTNAWAQTQWDLKGTSDTYTGTAGASRSFTKDGNALRVAAFTAPTETATLTPAFVSIIDTNSTMPKNSGNSGGVGVTGASESPTTANPYIAQADNQSGYDFLIFALPADDWETPKFHVNEAFTSANPMDWRKGRTDVTWWVGGTLADGGTEADPFAEFAGKTIAQITGGWTQGSSTNAYGDRMIQASGKGRYLIVAPEVTNTNDSDIIDAFFVDQVAAGQAAPSCADAQAPSFTAPAGITANANASCATPVPNFVSLVTDERDDCTDSPPITQSPAAGSTVGEGVTTVTLTARDDAGRTTTRTVRFTVVDAPRVAECPGSRDILADEDCMLEIPDLLGEFSADDACTTDPAWGYSQWPAAGAPLAYGANVVTLTATDAAGNDAECSVTVTLVDESEPFVTCPPDVLTVPTDPDSCSAASVDVGTATAYDNCSGAELLEIEGFRNDDPLASLSGPYGLAGTSILWSATDMGGNSAVCEQIIQVVDVQAPDLECPADLVLSTDPGVCAATVTDLGQAISTDNCDGAGDASSDAPADGWYDVGTTSVSWSVNDAAGNAESCTQTVTVADHEAPAIECPEDVVLVTAPYAGQPTCQAAFGDLGTPTVADNCEGATWSNDAIFPYGLGDSSVAWTAIDGAGNASTDACEQGVTVVSGAAVEWQAPLAGQPVAYQINAPDQKLPIKVRLLDCAGLPLGTGVTVLVEVEGILAVGAGDPIVIEEVAEIPMGRGEPIAESEQALMQPDGASGQYHFNIDTTTWAHQNTAGNPDLYYLATVSVYDRATGTFLGSDSQRLETKPKANAK